MNTTLTYLSLSEVTSLSPHFLPSFHGFSFVSRNINIRRSFPSFFLSLKHFTKISFKDSVFSSFLSTPLILLEFNRTSQRQVITSEAFIEGMEFVNISSPYDGSGLACEVLANLTLRHSIFDHCETEGEGGGLKVGLAMLKALCLLFRSCRTSQKPDSQGGNAIRTKEINGEFQDITAFKCAPDSRSGDSTLIIDGKDVKIRTYNATQCMDNGIGHPLALWKLIDNTQSFIQTMNGAFSGCFEVSWANGNTQVLASNFINMTTTSVLYYKNPASVGLEFQKCCFFGISNARVSQEATFIDCFGDIGSLVTPTRFTVNKIVNDPDCFMAHTDGFTQEKWQKQKIKLKVFMMFTICDRS